STGGRRADATDIVDVVLGDLDVVRGGGEVEPVERAPHLEALEADVAGVEAHTDGRGVVLAVDDGSPLGLGREHDQARGGTAAPDGEHGAPARVPAVPHDHPVSRVDDVGRVLNGAERVGAIARIRVVTGRG